jgi:hypothetical protein
MLATILCIWGGLVIWTWAMLHLDRVTVFSYAPWALAMASVSMSSFYGLLNLLAGWQPHTPTGLMLAAVALSIIADRRRSRRRPGCGFNGLSGKNDHVDRKFTDSQ